MRTLFLQAPSFDGFDGGAGARYQARREIRSFWYPTWLAQVAACVPDSKLIDAAPHRLPLADVVRDGAQLRPRGTAHLDAVVRVRRPVVEALKAANPAPQGRLRRREGRGRRRRRASRHREAIDFVAGNEFDFTIKEVAEGRDWRSIAGLSYRDDDGAISAQPAARRAREHGRTALRHAGLQARPDDRELLHRLSASIPYVSLYTGRGCKSRCTFCLWPQTVGGHRYRTRSVGHVVEEIRWAKAAFPQVKEFFFDDDTFTDDRPRTEAIARELGKLGVTWSCNAKANVPCETLKVMRDNGLRLLLVGYETGNQQILHNIKKGMRVDVARRFTKDCHELGITIHGTFILGLPGETRETIKETIHFAKEINPHTIQVSLAAPYPGTELYRRRSRTAGSTRACGARR